MGRIDETRQKMEQSSQQSQLADERRKLDETRSEAQKAAESMERKIQFNTPIEVVRELAK